LSPVCFNSAECKELSLGKKLEILTQGPCIAVLVPMLHYSPLPTDASGLSPRLTTRLRNTAIKAPGLCFPDNFERGDKKEIYFELGLNPHMPDIAKKLLRF